ncbi:MAG: undecaprenyl/decaprenyl-phosphate alpha-N-acetylglucosaminyl 1-phosphate transferase [Bacteroidetes bacterium]|nr:undecaprenyl/decaprenyl-phosphate alpha-N-acetylglucosaminyl 1-phosphate transferase [Bacteroidota bacterium]MBU1718603.1 undecaprenyl/decaprenyl-phosphate alpha-N-acetylglucosaminyl 1-phosphate transferase [Bacteroidota bacterium]
MQGKILPYIIFLGVAILFTVLINGLFLKFSRTLGVRNPDTAQSRWNANIRPSLGGISFFIVFLISFAAYAIIDREDVVRNIELLGFLLAATIGFLIGLADDAYDTKPFMKFLGQLTVASTLIATGTYIHIFEIDTLNYLITVIWVVGLMNSVNMLDNMDSITTSVSIFILIPPIVFHLIYNGIESSLFIIYIGIIASLIGFLYHNWNPAKMFMGDTGSQFLGAVLAGIGIQFFWNHPDIPADSMHIKQFLLAITAFSIPIADTTTVVINRLLRKQSPFVGGKDHTTHCLGYLGFSDRSVAWIFIGISAINAVATILIVSISKWTTFHTLAFLFLPVATFLSLFYISRKVRHHCVQQESQKIN